MVGLSRVSVGSEYSLSREWRYIKPVIFHKNNP